MKPLCRKNRNILITKSKVILKEISPLLLYPLKQYGGDYFIFVEAKKFELDEVSNRRNSIVIA